MAEIARLDILINSAQVKAGAEQVKASLDQVGTSGDNAAKKVEGAFDRLQNKLLQTKATMATMGSATDFKKTVSGLSEVKETYSSLQAAMAAQIETQLQAANSADPYKKAAKDVAEANDNLSSAAIRANREMARLGMELSRGNWQGVLRVLAGQAAQKGLITAALSPIGIAIGGMVASLGLAAKAWDSYNQKQTEAIAVTTGLGRALGMTASEFQDFTAEMGQAGDLSIAQAQALGAQLARTGVIGKENIGSIIKLTKDFAATIGSDVKTAGETLAKTFADPGKGVEALNQQLAFLDANTMKTVQSLLAQGRAQDAIKVTLDKLPGALAKAEVATSAWSRAWDDVASAASNAFNWVGKAVDRAVFGMGDVEKLAIIAHQLEEIGKIEGKGQQSARAEQNMIIRKNTLLAEQATIMRKVNETAFQTAVVAKGAELNRISTEVAQLAASAAPATAELQRLKDQLVNLNRGTDLPGNMVGDQKALADAIDATSRAIETYLPPAEKSKQLAAINLQLITATDSATKARLLTERQKLELAGQLMTREEASIKIATAGQEVMVSSNKERRDEIALLDQQLALFGMVGRERELEAQVLEKVNAARRSGNAYSPEEVENLRKKLELQQNLNGVQSQLERIYNDTTGPQQMFADTLAAANKLLDEGKISLDQYGKEIASVRIKVLETQNTFASGLQAALLKVTSDYANIAQSVENGVGAIFSGLEDQLTSLVTTGKLNIQDLASTVIQEVARMAIRISVLQPLMSSLFGPAAGGGGGGIGGLFGSLFGGLFGGGGLGAGSGTSTFGGIYHDGGIVGKDTASASYSSALERMFKNNLAPNEQVTLLKKGEEVLTENDPRHKNNLTFSNAFAAPSNDNFGAVRNFLGKLPKYHDGGVVGGASMPSVGPTAGSGDGGGMVFSPVTHLTIQGDAGPGTKAQLQEMLDARDRVWEETFASRMIEAQLSRQVK